MRWLCDDDQGFVLLRQKWERVSGRKIQICKSCRCSCLNDDSLSPFSIVRLVSELVSRYRLAKKPLMD